MNQAVLMSLALSLAIPLCSWADSEQPFQILNPPSQEEIRTADQVEFVILSREPVTDRSHEYSTFAWEVRLAPEPTVTRRVQFEDSSWAPDLLVCWANHQPAQLIRHQVNSMVPRGRGYSVTLYHIDYSTWDVRTLLQRDTISEKFLFEDQIYIWTSDRELGDRMLVFREGELREVPQQFEHIQRVTGSERYLFVERDDAEQSVAIFDAATERFLELPTVQKALFRSGVSSAVSSDERFIVLHSEADIEWGGDDLVPLHTFAPSTSTIRVLDRESSTSVSLPISLDVAKGSGIRYFYKDPIEGFDEQGRLVYWESTTQRVRVDLAASPLFNEPIAAPQQRAIDAPDHRPDLGHVPAEVVAQLPEHWEPHDLIHAFLKHHELEFEVPTATMDTNYAFSSDRKRFLAKMLRSGRDDVFILGDLVANTLIEIPCPDSLRAVNDLNIIAVK